MIKILIVDDEERIRDVLCEYGKVYGYDVYQASDGYQAIDLVKQHSFSCVILDIMMPNIDGFATCEKIKKIENVPIIMLSARIEEEDKLYGFDLGIDDYVTKPFSPKELMARIKVVIDRYKKDNGTEIIIDGININKDYHVVKVDNNEIHLTNKEFNLLVYLIENVNRVIDRETLIANVWGDENSSIDRTVDTHIKMLRKNLGPYGKKIITVRGIGYKFEN